MESDQKSESYNLLVASVREAVNDSVQKQNYTENDLESLSKPELISIILHIQNELKNLREKQNKSKKSKQKSPSPASPRPNQEIQKKPKIKSTERMATDYDKIHQKREEIKALKEKKRQEKLKAENTLKQRNMQRKFNHNPHEKMRAVIKATEKMATDYSKIEKQRQKIKAIKEKQKKAKLENPNGLKHRNMHRTNNLFSNPHEKVVKVKEIKQPKPKKKTTGNNKDKVVDPVNREIMQQREEIKDEVEHIHEINHDENDDESLSNGNNDENDENKQL